MQLNQQQKSFLLCYVLAIIPELPTNLHRIILEVRMRIMNNGGKDISETETRQILEKMCEHKLVVIEDGKIMRKVKLNPQFLDPTAVEFIKAMVMGNTI